MAWLDTGTPKSLLDASNFIAALEIRQGLKVACLEEVALRMGFLTLDQFAALASEDKKGTYFDYLRTIQREMAER
jgi:glucose-1-phosphate thymidylyltransferase